MYALVLALSLLGQVEVPPAPEISSSQNSSTTEELKAWLLGRLIIELKFDEAKIAEVETRLDKMSERQLRVLIEVYKDRVAKRDQAEAARQNYMQQQVLNQAKLDLMRAQGYKEYLQREYQASIVQKEMETNLVRQNIQNNNNFNWGGGGFVPNYNYGWGGGYGDFVPNYNYGWGGSAWTAPNGTRVYTPSRW